MGPFISYLLQVALIMTLLFLCYKVLLSSVTFHAFKRFTLLSILVGSWLLPPMVPLAAPLVSTQQQETQAGERSGNVAVEVGTPIAVTETAGSDMDATATAWHWLAPVYVCGFGCMLMVSLIAIMRLARVIGRGEKRRLASLTLVLNPQVAGPCSWGKFVVIRPADCDADMQLVLAHELRHLQRMHWLDTILAQVSLIFLWFNPISYMLLRELKVIHEYDADRAIPDAQTRRYQLMLIKKTVGSSFPTFANSLYHSQIKKRITMMMKRKSSAARLLTALALPGAAALAVLTLSQPSVAQILASVSASSMEPLSAGKVNQNSADAQIAAAVDAISMPVTSTADDAKQSKSSVTDPASEVSDAIESSDSDAQRSVPQSKSTAPTYFVDGKLFPGDLNDLNIDDIKAMTVVKDDPAYPNGRIMIETKSNADKVAVAAAKQAEYKGGEGTLLQFIADNIKYPVGLKGEAKPIIQFTIDTEGGVSDCKVLRSGGEAADAEAIRVVLLTNGHWLPALNEDGKAIATRFVVPIVFKEK